jgi:hypothetical protein
MSGGVIIARNLWDDPAFQNEPFSEREAWVWMICEAAWKPREKRVGKVIVQLDRGQLAASIRFMAEAFSWHRNKADRFLKRLEKCNLIRIESGTGVNVITLCKYNEYQLSPKSYGTEAGQTRDRSGTNENKGERMEEGKERDTNVSLALIAPECVQEPDRFQEFWDQYPHRGGAKKGKASAQKAWAKAIRARASPAQIIAGALRYAGDRQVMAGYAKDPASWLNQKGWEDEVEPDHGTSRQSGSGPSGSRNGMVDAFAAVAARYTARDARN